jgi:tripartite-type tricarboxylate transporter receptor subunit TctC
MPDAVKQDAKEDRMTITRRTLLAAPLVAASVQARAQDAAWPNRPIRLVVSYAPGGATDVSARLLAPQMAERLGQSVIVENRTGGSGTVSGSYVAQSAPDGYTLLCDTFSHIVNPVLQRNLSFDYATAFTGISRIASFPQVIAVKRGSPFNDMQSLVAATKAQPGMLSAGFAGLGTAGHLLLERLRFTAGAALNTVPYRGASDAARDLAGGTLDVAALAFSTAVPLDEAAQIKILGVATEERLPTRPGVPTLVESGLAGFVISDFAAIFAPAATPPAVRARILQALQQSLQEPMVMARMEQMAVTPGGESAEIFNAWIVSTRADMAKLIHDAGIRIE